MDGMVRVDELLISFVCLVFGVVVFFVFFVFVCLDGFLVWGVF